MHARIARIAHILVNSRASIRIINVSNGENDIAYNGDVAELEFVMGLGNGSRLANPGKSDSDVSSTRPRIVAMTDSTP